MTSIISSGSEGAFYAAAFSFVSKITGKFFRYDKAYDVTMEALRHLWEKRANFKPSRGTFEGWAYYVVKNYCLDVIAAEKSLTYVENITLLGEKHKDFVDWSEGKDDDYEAYMNSYCNVLSSMATKKRNLITLSLGKVPTLEIARLTGLKHNAARTAISRAKKDLRKAVAADFRNNML